MKKLLFILLCLPIIGVGQTKTLGADIVSPNSKIKEIFSGGDGALLEGPPGPKFELFKEIIE